MGDIDAAAVRVPVGLPSAVERLLLDVFAPEVVVWAYEGPAEPALRTLLNLVHPQHPDAPTSTYVAPCSLQVPRHEQRPLTIRPPSLGRAGVRAARLAAAMAKSAPRLVQPDPGWGQGTRDPVW